MKRALAAAIVLCAALALAQVVGGNTQLVTTAATPPVKVKPGRTAPVQFLFRVNSGLHINPNKPTSELLVPTKLDLQLPEGMKFAKMTYPAGHDFTVAFSNDKLNVYTGDFEVDGTLAAAKTVKPGSYDVAGVLRYQACNDRQCFPPKKLPVKFRVEVK